MAVKGRPPKPIDPETKKVIDRAIKRDRELRRKDRVRRADTHVQFRLSPDGKKSLKRASRKSNPCAWVRDLVEAELTRLGFAV